ncbi:hypothetical protein K435DRAFT_815972 [Dendrothele bispora CBS 962.96]|uniref:protein-serine/threonine phosphatase n=1 Tax=Dendrothele bispora (strain CBS 962.96) TaxID=1314807 RepID=A0A4S8MTR2_DENBC|nr:hypothetical protein K435DRAFT_815972 [Dendrothele bispora CBS 962.96]
MSTVDLSNVSELKEYLEITPFACDDFEVLSGGTGNFVCRIKLRSPYEGSSTAVVKHAKPYVFSTRNTERYPFALERQRFEVESLRLVKEWLPPDSFVTVPEVHLFDEKESVIIMEDSGQNSVTFKEFILRGRCSPEVGTRIGSALGEFLGQLHVWGKDNLSKVVELLGPNEPAKKISGWATYGRLVSTLKGDDNLDALSGAPLGIPEDQLEIIKDVGEKTQQIMLSAEESFLMGDFWTGNILLQLDEADNVKRIYVIDWELAKPGLCGWDLGQLAAELDLLRRFHPSQKEVASNAISSFYQSYSRVHAGDIALYRTAVTHWGNHLVVWTPRVAWGDRDTTRQTVLSGVEMIIEGQNGAEEKIYKRFSPTQLYLPPSFPYPIKVVSIDTNVSSEIERGTRLLSYSFVYLSRTAGAQPETRFGTWDSAIEGTLKSWNIRAGDVISQRKAKEKPVGIVIEPCKHGMQLGGLCVLCGKDMTNTDYIGFSDASRASIQMTHSANGPTVSLEEAQRIEKETAERLLKSRKLSLIVDLDQTIVHATVDPTVGEWISEGEAWEARHTAKAAHGEGAEEDGEDECNPNWEALKDVKKFRLGPESFGTVPRGKGKAVNRGVESEGCMYYIKPRPGWREFLKEVSTKYEMHVYTMGTRAYAEEVCAAIDPDGTAFGGRLLSRDESGSLTQKSLQRLFPCDTSMVVIIDDRADVWEWSPNLVKVIPYDFFVGIGDINSTFLPKIEPLTASTPSPSTPTVSSSDSLPLATPETTTPEDVERTAFEAKAKLTENSLALEAQVEARPLAKKQEELQSDPVTDSLTKSDEIVTENVTEQPSTETKEKEEVQSTIPTKTPRKALLKNDDTELVRVYKLLSDIHQQFFDTYDAHSSDIASKSSQKKGNEKIPWDVTRIIPSIRSEVFKGVNLLFSSVIPLDTRPETTEIWRMAVMFGAKCSVELTPDITHVVAAKRGTVKVDMARKRGGIKIVWLVWFTDSVALWQRQDETPYLLDDPPAAGPSTSPLSFHQMSSDPDLDEEEEWELEATPVSGPGSGNADTGSPNFEASQINWDDINDEVEAAMMESDDDDDMSEVNIGVQDGSTGIQSANASEDEWTDESNSVISSSNNTPKKTKRKRLRSLTPSEAGINGGDNDVLRSPLSKRKKLAADRSGYSKLKEAISAEELRPEAGSVKTQSDDGSSDERVTPTKATKENNNEEVDDDGYEEEDDDDDDDFLAKEMEEEWG